MKYNIKRALSLLLALSMTVSLLGVSAFAAEEAAPETLPEAAGTAVEQERPEVPEDAAPVRDGEETQTPEEETAPAPEEETPAEAPEAPSETTEAPQEESPAPEEETEPSQPEETEPADAPQETQPQEPDGPKPPVAEPAVSESPVPQEDLSEAALPEIIQPDMAVMRLALQAEEPGLQELVEAGGLVRLGRDYTESITVTGDVTLNLNGRTLTNTPGQHTITVAPGGTLTITGYGTVDNESHGMSAVYNEGTVILESGIYDRSQEAGTLSGNGYSTTDGGNSAATLYNGGDMVIGGDVRIQQAESMKTNEYGYRGFHSPLISNWGALTITGGEFYGGKNNIRNESGADLEVSDGAFYENLGFSLWNGGAARISGGSFTSWNAAAVWNQGSELIITGGNFTAVDRDGKGKRATIENGSGSSAQIFGGRFGNDMINYNKDTGNGPLPETVVLDKSTDGIFLVRGRTKADGDTEAAIGDACYTSLPAAIRAAGQGDEVVLLRDYEKDLYKEADGTVLLAPGKELTLNLGEKQIKGYLVNGGAELTIKATTGGVNGAGKPYAIFNAAGALTLESGVYTTDGQDGINNKGSLTVNGGEITARGYALNDDSAAGTQLAVNGGTLRGSAGAVQSKNNTGFINGGLFSHDVTPCCAPGRKAEGPNSDGLWEVLVEESAAVAQVGSRNYSTLAEALQAAQNGETVLLLKSVEETVSLSKTLTLNLNGNTVTNRTAGHTVTVEEGGSLTLTGAGGIYNTASDRAAVYNLGQLRVESGTFSSAAAGYALLNAGAAEVADGAFQARVENGENGSLTIRGGSFAHPVDPAHCAPGFLPVVNGSTYGVLEATLSVTLDRTTGSLNTGNTLGLTATVRPENVTLDKTVTWTSDDEGVATVNADGLVTAVAEGTANITAAIGEARAVCALTVTRQSGGGGGGGTGGGGTGGGSTGGGSTGGGSTGGDPVDQPPVESIDEEQTPLSEKPFLFEDVAQTDWFYEAVKYVFDHDIMEGVTETLFQPYGNTTRGMIVTMLYRAEGSPEAGEAPFADVPAGEWYSSAVAWAAEKDVVKGYEDGTFAPERRITREELSAILYRYAALKGYDVTGRDDLAGFTEADQISDWAVESVRWAVASGLIQGKESGRLDPTGTTSRSEAAAILARFHQAHSDNG